MRPLALLHCIGRAALRQAANLAGFGLGDVVEDVWREWNRDGEEAARRAELQAIVRMAAEEFRAQVIAVMAAVAAGQPAQVQRRVSECLEQVPEVVRRALRRAEDQEGRSVPPDLPLREASDLAAILTGSTEAPAAAGACVTLHLTAGANAGERIVCDERTVLLFGRSKECQPRYSEHRTLSRNHCLVEINPPDVRLRDLGSLHGTFVTGSVREIDSTQFTPVRDVKLGGRPRGAPPDPQYASRELDLADGAEVRLTSKSPVAFRVQVMVPARCEACEAAIPEADKEACARKNGGYLCASCRSRAQEKAASKKCTWCQRSVTGERGANRAGQFVCAACRENMKGIMQEMLGKAEAGEPSLRAIRSYTLLQELGHGGMGAVYLARHQKTDQPAAIKLMLPQVAADERAVDLFQREIRNTMALQHRNVVQFLDHGYARGAFFMVLEYCDGGSVDRLLSQQDGPLPIDEAVEIVLQALEGLEYAHQAPIPFVRQKGGGTKTGRGLVHRDLKPANLFLSGRGSRRVVKIGDYGLAKAFDETGLSGGSRTGTAAGTWKYMCRQQVTDYKHARPAVDVWAMAATLYYLLTRHVPREFPKSVDPWLVVLENDAVPIRQRNTRIPEALAKVIDRALIEEPALPFQSAAEFRQALEEAV